MLPQTVALQRSSYMHVRCQSALASCGAAARAHARASTAPGAVAPLTDNGETDLRVRFLRYGTRSGCFCSMLLLHPSAYSISPETPAARWYDRKWCTRNAVRRACLTHSMPCDEVASRTGPTTAHSAGVAAVWASGGASWAHSRGLWLRQNPTLWCG